MKFFNWLNSPSKSNLESFLKALVVFGMIVAYILVVSIPDNM